MIPSEAGIALMLVSSHMSKPGGLMSLRRFFRLLLRDPGPSGVDHSLAKTAKDALHIRGAGGQTCGGGFSGTSTAYKHIEEGHKNYAESFKKKDG